MTKARTLADFNTAGVLTSTSTLNPANLDSTGTIPSALLAGGVTVADQWRLTSSKTGNQEPLASSLERVDTDGFSVLGSGMSQSSGIWTFPETGHYLVMGNVYFSKNGAQRKVGLEIQTTLNNSSYSVAAEGFSHQSDEASSEPTLSSVQATFVFDVTDTSTHKLRFYINTNNDSGVSIGGSTDANLTYFTFIKLSDT